MNNHFSNYNNDYTDEISKQSVLIEKLYEHWKPLMVLKLYTSPYKLRIKTNAKEKIHCLVHTERSN